MPRLDIKRSQPWTHEQQRLIRLVLGLVNPLRVRLQLPPLTVEQVQAMPLEDPAMLQTRG